MSKDRSPRDLANKDLFTTGEAATICNVSQQTIIRCFDRGEIEGFRVPGSRARRIPRSALIGFMERSGLPVDRLEKASRRILVVDGDAELPERLAAALGDDRRYVVRGATSGFEGGLLAARFKPNVIVLSAAVPAVDAETLRARLDGLANLRRTPVLLATDAKDGGARRAAAGARDAAVDAPIDVRRLARRIATMMRGRG